MPIDSNTGKADRKWLKLKEIIFSEENFFNQLDLIQENTSEAEILLEKLEAYYSKLERMSQKPFLNRLTIEEEKSLGAMLDKLRGNSKSDLIDFSTNKVSDELFEFLSDILDGYKFVQFHLVENGSESREAHNHAATLRKGNEDKGENSEDIYLGFGDRELASEGFPADLYYRFKLKIDSITKEISFVSNDSAYFNPDMADELKGLISSPAKALGLILDERGAISKTLQGKIRSPLGFDVKTDLDSSFIKTASLDGIKNEYFTGYQGLPGQIYGETQKLINSF